MEGGHFSLTSGVYPLSIAKYRPQPTCSIGRIKSKGDGSSDCKSQHASSLPTPIATPPPKEPTHRAPRHVHKPQGLRELPKALHTLQDRTRNEL